MFWKIFAVIAWIFTVAMISRISDRIEELNKKLDCLKSVNEMKQVVDLIAGVVLIDHTRELGKQKKNGTVDGMPCEEPYL